MELVWTSDKSNQRSDLALVNMPNAEKVIDDLLRIYWNDRLSPGLGREYKIALSSDRFILFKSRVDYVVYICRQF